MKNNKFNLILLILTVLVGVFLYFEYRLDKDKYHQESLSSFQNTYKSSIENYEKIIDYTIGKNFSQANFLDILEKKESKKLEIFIDNIFLNVKNNEFRYIDILDENGSLIYSYFGTYNHLNKNKVLKNSLITKRKSQGYFFSKTIQSYRFVYPIFKDKKVIAFIDLGIDLSSLIKNANNSSLNKIDILPSKILLSNVSRIKYKDSSISNYHYEIYNSTPNYPLKYSSIISNEIEKNILDNNGFVVDIINSDIIYNKITFIKIKDNFIDNYGLIAYFSNDNTLERILVLQFTKFIIIVLMVWLLYSLYSKSEESSYFSKQLLEALYKINIVSKTNTKGLITFVNDKFCEISGYKEEELIGKNHNIVRHEEMPKEFYSKMWKTIESKRIFSGLIKNKRKDSSAYYVNSTIIPILDTKDNIKEYLAIRNDVGNIINAQKQLAEDIKTYDNPCCINVRIDNYDMHSNIYPGKFLTKLEDILAEEIITLMPAGLEVKNTYSILNGEYAFIFDRKDLGINEITILLKKLLQNLNANKIKIDDYIYEFQFVIAFSTEDQYALENQRIAIKKLATNEIKENIVCSNGFALQSQQVAKKNLEIMKMIEDALIKDNLVSFFQPIYNLHTEKIEKYESLIRIKNNEEIISPYYFIDVAKKSTLYKKITLKVLENSFEMLDRNDYEVTINLSATDVEDIDIRNKLLGYITDPEYYGRVTFEFLEDETIGDFNVIKDFISLSKIMGGVKLAIDDFGSGYSNYERLVEMKPEIVKIDGTLIKDIHKNISSQNIVKSIVQFAKSENIKTVAEFVSDKEVYDCVKSLEIDYVQGYYIGKPEDLR